MREWAMREGGDERGRKMLGGEGDSRHQSVS